MYTADGFRAFLVLALPSGRSLFTASNSAR